MDTYKIKGEPIVVLAELIELHSFLLGSIADQDLSTQEEIQESLRDIEAQIKILEEMV